MKIESRSYKWYCECTTCIY